MNAGSSLSYQWVKNNISVPGATNGTYTYSPTNPDVITCVVTSNASTTTSNSITIIINTPNLSGTVSIAASPSGGVCPGTSVTFTATPVASFTPYYLWKVNGISKSSSSNTFTYTPVNNDAVSCVITSCASCGNSSTSNVITESVVPYVAVTLTNSQSTPTSANFQQQITVISSNYTSYESSGLQNIEFSTSPSANGNILQAWIESGASNASAVQYIG